MLTLEEQERLAYIQGDLAKAELLAALMDAEEQNRQDEDAKESYREGWDDGYEVGYEEGSTCD